MGDNYKKISLNTLFNRYNVTVWDTSAIFGYLNGTKISTTDHSLVPRLTKKLKEGHKCILPQKIIEEIKRYKNITPLEAKAINELVRACGKFSPKNKLYSLEKKIEDEIRKESKKYAWYGISHPDLAVFECAKIFSKTGASAAIVSNDIKGISRVWRKYTEGKEIPNSALGFLARVNKDSFKVFA